MIYKLWKIPNRRMLLGVKWVREKEKDSGKEGEGVRDEDDEG